MTALIEQLRHELCGWPTFPRSLLTGGVALLPLLLFLLETLYSRRETTSFLRELNELSIPQLDARRTRRRRVATMFFLIITLGALASLVISVLFAVALSGCPNISMYTAWRDAVLATFLAAPCIWYAPAVWLAGRRSPPPTAPN